MSRYSPPRNYHSALGRADYTGIAPKDRVFFGDSVAFCHDFAMHGPAPEHVACSVLFAELPWRPGYEDFLDRAEVTQRSTFSTFMARVKQAVLDARIPIVLIAGKHALSALPAPDWQHPIDLNGGPAVALGFRAGTPPVQALRTAIDLTDWLALEYPLVGDFCCGYGRTARASLAAGRPFVASDINPYCIGYIAAHARSWMRE